MAKLVNKTSLIGPYPGRTWEQEAAAMGKSLFPLWVIAKIEKDKCDQCMEPCLPTFTCCCKKCYVNMCLDSEAEAAAEAAVS